MSFLIDTDIASAHLRGAHDMTAKFLQYMGQLHISAVSVAELKSWVYRNNTPARFRQGLNDMLADFAILSVRCSCRKSWRIGRKSDESRTNCCHT
jgi:predicted nucleic acid-binding protein